MSRHLVRAFVVLALVGSASAQQDHSAHAGHHSAYATQESSGVAALSRQEYDDLTAGAGMGMARAAELNHFPGPKHVLELAPDLGLSERQAAEVEAIRVVMARRAVDLGAEIVEKERHLDLRFDNRHIDEATLRATTAEIAALYGELRFAHLRAHLATREVLSDAQIELYDELRGY